MLLILSETRKASLCTEIRTKSIISFISAILLLINFLPQSVAWQGGDDWRGDLLEHVEAMGLLHETRKSDCNA